MLERYWAWNYEIKDLGLWPGEGYKGHNMPVEVVKAEDAQATIADIQGQVKLANIDQANVEAERNDLQQRVDQLEGELERMKAIKHDDNTQMERAESDKWDAKDHASTLMQRAIYAEGRVRALLKDGDDKDARIKALIIDNDNYRRKYHALQADHARVLGLVQALQELCAEVYQVVGSLADSAGVFDAEATVKVLDNLSAASSGEPLPHKDLLPFPGHTKASLPAQPAQGGA